ncbi:MAG: hypothetical protein ACPGVO_08250, partial [Spirulinaceae cyanobacterium]
STAAIGRKAPGTVARKAPGTIGRKAPGTVAQGQNSAQKQGQNPVPLPLSQQEQEHLQTRAAIPYRDPELRATAAEILANRSQEQAECHLESTGEWKRRWRLN